MKSIIKTILRASAVIVALLVVFSINDYAQSAELSLVPELGYVHMSSAPDDFWYEQGLPHTTDFDSAAFGAGLRLDARHFQLSAGWRNLGNQHQHGQIMGDAAYFACAPHNNCVGHATQYWDMTGSTSQTFLEAGYAFKVGGGWSLVPEVGVARTKFSSHVNMYSYPGLVPRVGPSSVCRTGNEYAPKLFYGVSAQKGGFGIGAQLLDTGPDRSGNDCTSPIQGSSAIYVRLTYAFKL
jgi:hypothetical protein